MPQHAIMYIMPVGQIFCRFGRAKVSWPFPPNVVPIRLKRVSYSSIGNSVPTHGNHPSGMYVYGTSKTLPMNVYIQGYLSVASEYTVPLRGRVQMTACSLRSYTSIQGYVATETFRRTNDGYPTNMRFVSPSVLRSISCWINAHCANNVVHTGRCSHCRESKR